MAAGVVSAPESVPNMLGPADARTDTPLLRGSVGGGWVNFAARCIRLSPRVDSRAAGEGGPVGCR